MKIGIAALAALSLSTAAFAGTAGTSSIDNAFGKDSAVLSLDGINLATADGQQRLAIRVGQAARAVCGENLANIHLDVEARARACRADVAEQVRTQIEARTADASRGRSVQLAALR